MDEYRVEFSGENLNTEHLIAKLKELSIGSVARRGDYHRQSGDEIRKKNSAGPFDKSCLTLHSPWESLLELLKHLQSRNVKVGYAGSEEILVWGYLKREGQINGELSLEEITIMSELGAGFCWSVDFSS